MTLSTECEARDSSHLQLPSIADSLRVVGAPGIVCYGDLILRRFWGRRYWFADHCHLRHYRSFADRAEGLRNRKKLGQSVHLQILLESDYLACSLNFWLLSSIESCPRTPD